MNFAAEDRAWSLPYDRLEVELEVHAGADEIFSQADGDGDRWTVWRHAIRPRSDHAGGCRTLKAAVTEVEKEIFDLGGPVVGKGPFDTAAGSPAGLFVAGVKQIVIDGTCSSACTLVLGIVPRDRICVTSNAILGFHAAWRPEFLGLAVINDPGTQTLWNIYPSQIRQWTAVTADSAPQST